MMAVKLINNACMEIITAVHLSTAHPVGVGHRVVPSRLTSLTIEQARIVGSFARRFSLLRFVFIVAEMPETRE